MSGPVAAIDIGTNTLLLLILDEKRSIIVDRCEFGRLGKGLDASGNLSEASIVRSLEIAAEYKQLLEEHEVSEVAIVGTQALREAANAHRFTEPAQALFGAPIQTIPGEREAELVYRGVAGHFPDLAKGELVVADVGGGSTEFVVGSKGTVGSFSSIPIGSVRMSERHLKDDPPSQEQVRALMADVDSALEKLELPQGATLIGTAGTATTLAAVHQRLPKYSRDAVHGYQLSPAALDRLLATLLEASLEERKRMPGMEAPRAEVIAGGAAIFSRILARTRASEFLIADCGVRWGLAYELLGS